MALERNPPEGSKAGARGDGVEITDTTAEFEEYTSAPRLDDKGQPLNKPKGLRAAGYQFPPESGSPVLTKANLAKGIGVPEVPRVPPTVVLPNRPIAPPLPGMAPAPRAGTYETVSAPRIEPPRVVPTVKVDEGALFEEYQRPDLKDHPKTGKGIRSEAPPPASAKELLGKWEQPEPDVVIPKRFSVMPVPPRSTGSQDETQAELDAMADVAAAAPDAVMSSPLANGPSKVVIHHDDDDREEPVAPEPLAPAAAAEGVPEIHVIAKSAEVPNLEPLTPPTFAAPATTVVTQSMAISAQRHAEPEAEPTVIIVAAPHLGTIAAHLAPEVQVPFVMPATQPSPAPLTPSIPSIVRPAAPTPPSMPHRSDAPDLDADGPVPRIAIVQCDFNLEITNAMVESARKEADRLGAPIAATLHVPGVFDAPLAAKRLLEKKSVDAVIVVGCVIQGETGHDELITHAAAQTLLAIACNLDKPVGLAVTGPRMTKAQAWARVGSGAFAVASVVQQFRVLKLA